jgi:hypothetical protein
MLPGQVVLLEEAMTRVTTRSVSEVTTLLVLGVNARGKGGFDQKGKLIAEEMDWK